MLFLNPRPDIRGTIFSIYPIILIYSCTLCPEGLGSASNETEGLAAEGIGLKRSGGGVQVHGSRGEGRPSRVDRVNELCCHVNTHTHTHRTGSWCVWGGGGARGGG